MEKKLGFGCMRLPMKDGNVDYDEFNKMIDKFINKEHISDDYIGFFNTKTIYRGYKA